MNDVCSSWPGSTPHRWRWPAGCVVVWRDPSCCLWLHYLPTPRSPLHGLKEISVEFISRYCGARAVKNICFGLVDITEYKDFVNMKSVVKHLSYVDKLTSVSQNIFLMFYHSLLSKNKSHQLDTRGQQPGRRALPRRCDTWADPSWCSAACAPQGRSPQPWWTGTSWSTSSFLLGWTWCWERYQCRALQGHINHDPLTDLNVTDFLYGEYIVK